MKITELSNEQQVALVAIMEAIVMSDGTVEDGEQNTIGQIAEELGIDTYRELLREADKRYPTIDALKQLLKTITDQEARETIYGLAMQDAMLSPAINHLQSKMLEWLRENWNITVKTVDS